MPPPTSDIPRDESLRQILEILQEYRREHPAARVDAYRQHSTSLRIRIVDPDFGDQDAIERENDVWRLLDKLPPSTRGEITVLLLLTPQEAEQSFASFEFDNPVASTL